MLNAQQIVAAHNITCEQFLTAVQQTGLRGRQVHPFGARVWTEREIERIIQAVRGPSEADIQAALDFGKTAEQHLKG